jgi:carboxyl-terminal processing protease
LHHDKAEPAEYTIVRDEIPVESVRGDRPNPDGTWQFVLEHEPRIGYFRVTSFGVRTSEDLRAAITKSMKDFDGLILDLRGNAGGLLTAAIEICSMFLPEGQLVVTTRGRDPHENRLFHSESGPLVDANMPVVVLVDRTSASASEIVAACLQDHGRAQVVGERTWGKGTVQEVIQIEGGKSAIRLTTHSYWRPNGVNIHRHRDDSPEDPWGVTPRPEHLVELTVDEHRQIYEQRRRRDYPNLPPSVFATPDSAEPPDDPIDDSQLQKAIEVLRPQMGATHRSA